MGTKNADCHEKGFEQIPPPPQTTCKNRMKHFGPKNQSIQIQTLDSFIKMKCKTLESRKRLCCLCYLSIVRYCLYGNVCTSKRTRNTLKKNISKTRTRTYIFLSYCYQPLAQPKSCISQFFFKPKY